jgi:hypothetical protein
MMAEVVVPPGALLLPLLLLGAVAGFRRSWARETITGLALAVVLVAFDRLVGLALGTLRVLARTATELARAAGVEAPNLGRALEGLPPALVVLVCTVLFVVGAYWLGQRLGAEGGESRLRRLGGAVVGALNVLLLVAILSARAHDILGPARMRRLLLVPGSGRGMDVQVSPFPSSGVLAQWSAYVVVLLVLVAFGWALTRLPRLRG